MPRRLKNILIPGILLLLVLAVWAAAVRLFHVNHLVIPTPLEVGRALVLKRGILARQTAITMSEALGGFVLGSVTAYLVAILFVYSDTLRRAFYPYAVALKSTPIIAIAPILIIWFGNGLFSKVVMAALVAFFPVLVNAVDGLSSVGVDTMDLMQSLTASHWQVLVKVRIPNSLPALLAGLKVASSLAVVGAVIGEFTGATEGIGYLINVSSYYLDTPLMFAGVIMIGLAGVAFFKVLEAIEPTLIFGRVPSESPSLFRVDGPRNMWGLMARHGQRQSPRLSADGSSGPEGDLILSTASSTHGKRRFLLPAIPTQKTAGTRVDTMKNAIETLIHDNGRRGFTYWRRPAKLLIGSACGFFAFWLGGLVFPVIHVNAFQIPLGSWSAFFSGVGSLAVRRRK